MAQDKPKPDGPEKAIASLIGGAIGIASYFALGPVAMVPDAQTIGAVLVPILTSAAVWWKSNSRHD